jgi:hypothetical protein
MMTMMTGTMRRRTRAAVLKKAECATLQDYNGSNNNELPRRKQRGICFLQLAALRQSQKFFPQKAQPFLPCHGVMQ